MRRDHRRILARFRSCNLPLAIATGRFTKPKTPLNQRLCRFCKTSAIEDETHFLIACDLYSDIRYGLFKNAVDMNTNFLGMSDSDKLAFLMKTDRLQYKIASASQKMNRDAGLLWFTSLHVLVLFDTLCILNHILNSIQKLRCRWSKDYRLS